MAMMDLQVYVLPNKDHYGSPPLPRPGGCLDFIFVTDPVRREGEE